MYRGNMPLAECPPFILNQLPSVAHAMRMGFAISENHIYNLLFQQKYHACLYQNAEIPAPFFILNLDRYPQIAHGPHGSASAIPYRSPVFSAYGCLGYTNPFHKKLAESLSRHPQIHFNLLLGDNIYHDGVDEKTGHTLQNFYDAMYRSHASEHLKLSFACLGNHDYNYHGKKKTLDGPLRALKQVNYTYDGRRMNDFSGFQMPYRYYALYSASVFIIILDSNTLPWDESQQDWLESVHSHLAAIQYTGTVVIAMHHPLRTFGKRMITHDGKLYIRGAYHWHTTLLSQYDPSRPSSLPLVSLASLITNVFVRIGLRYHVVLCAHDHYTDVMILDNNAVQITATPSYPERIKFIAKKLDGDHTKESVFVKQIYGYSNAYETLRGSLRKLCFPVFFPTANAASADAQQALPLEYAYTFINADDDSRISTSNVIPRNPSPPLDGMDVLSNLMNFLTNYEDPSIRRQYSGLSSPGSPRVMKEMGEVLRREPASLEDIFKNLMEIRYAHLRSIISRITGPRSFLERVSHAKLHLRSHEMNGFYFFLPYIILSVSRQNPDLNLNLHRIFGTGEPVRTGNVVDASISRFSVAGGMIGRGLDEAAPAGMGAGGETRGDFAANAAEDDEVE